MISVFYQNSNIIESGVKTFIECNLSNFYEEINHHLEKTSRIFDRYHLIEYGELTLVNLFSNGIVRYDWQDCYNVLCEFGYNDIDSDKSGRADIIVENIITDEVFFIETKIHLSKEDAPTTPEWIEIDLIEKDCNRILNQAKRYLVTDYKNYFQPDIEKIGGMQRHSFYAVALIFDVVKFKNQEKITLWNYSPQIENEFYSFKTFPHKEFLYGLACYGKIEKYDLTIKNTS